MWKRIILILCLLFSCGCQKKISNNIGTIIEETDCHMVAINYPITGTKIDSDIQKEIDNTYKNFSNICQQDKAELNVDYTFHYIDQYINIALYFYINENNHVINRVKTFVYDTKNHKKLEIEDIVENPDIIWDAIGSKGQDQNNYSYIFDYQKLFIFIQNESDYEELTIPLEDLDLKVKINNYYPNKTISAIAPESIIDPNKKLVALTFDDGPSKYTEEILNILKKNDCNATFFVLGNKVSIYSDLLIESINNGNEIGNHSYNHKWMIKLNEKELENQINKTQNIIKEYTGYTPKLIRPTYGSLNDRIKKISSLDIVLWNVDTLDWKYKNPNKIVENATKRLKDGNIILMHDTHKQTLEALPKILEIIKKNGYTCVTISELKEANFIREKMNG